MKTLYVTYCSGKKKPIEEGTPEQLYNSQRITDFIDVCRFKKYDWAILSAKYGLFFPNEVKKNYNVTFKSVEYECRIVQNEMTLSKSESCKHLNMLIQQIGKSILENRIERVVFYCRPPLKWRKCYLHVLHAGTDNCKIRHDAWRDLLRHIKAMLSDGTGKIHIITALGTHY